MKILPALVALPLAAQTSWDLSDHFGVARIAQSVELPYTGGTIAVGTKRLIGPKGEAAFVQLRNGNLGFMQPAMRGSKKVRPYVPANGPGLNALASEKAPDGCWNTAQMNVLAVGDIVVPFASGSGVVSTDLTAGTNYFVVAVDSDACTTDSIEGYIDLSATHGGSVVSITSRGTHPWGFVTQGTAWDGGDGLYIRGAFVDGDPVRFACVETCTLPTGLSEGTTYYLDLISTDVYDVYADSGLSSKANVTAGGTGINEVISYWGYTLESSAPAANQTNPVVISEDANYYDITNGLTGVRLPKVNGSCDRAPIQGIRLSDGTWTAAGNPNTLYYTADNTYPPTTSATGFDSCLLHWDERSPVTVRGTIRYVKSAEVFLFSFEVQANSKLLQFEGDWTTMNASGFLQLPAAIDTARIRGLNSAVNDDTVETLVTGKDYRLGSWSIYDTSTADPMGVKYAHLYDADGASDSPLITLIGGWVDRMERTGCSNERNVTFETSHPATGGSGAFLSYGINKDFLSICTAWDPVLRKRRRWGIHVDTKANLPGSVSTMSDAALHAFQVAYAPSLSDLLTPQFAAPSDPAGGWPCAFMTSSQCSDLETDMRDADPTAYNNLWSIFNGLDFDSSVLITGIRSNDSTAARVHLMYALDQLTKDVDMLLNHQGNGTARATDGAPLAYYEAFYAPLLRLGGMISALHDSNTPAYWKTETKRMLGLYCGLAFDPNMAPMDKWESMGDGLGLGNQIDQMYLIRQIFASHCRSYSRVSDVEAFTRSDIFPGWLDRYKDNSGVVHNSTSYIETVTELLKDAYSAMRTNGVTLTQTETDLWSKQISQEEAISSPPDPRWSASGLRLFAGNGDYSYFKNTRFGTAARFTGDTGAKWTWETHLNKPASAFYLPVVLLHDWSGAITGSERTLGSKMMPKYAAVFRVNYGTANESYVYQQHGPAIDHMHRWQDGGLQIWALKAPVATFYNSHFSPNIFDRRVVNGTLMLATEKDWTLDGSSPLEGGGGLPTRFADSVDPTATLYTAGTYSFASGIQQARSGGPTWDQVVVMVAPNPAKPLVAMFNTFTGTGAGNNKVFFFTHHATGDFTCPDVGTCSPTVRDYTVSASNFPSASAAASLTQDTLNSFVFTGAGWPNNSGGVINWGWYVIPGGTTPQFNYGNWCAPLQGTSAGTLYGANPKECQHIVRVNAAGSLSALWHPYAKASSAGTVSSPASHTFRVVDGSATTNISKTQYDYTDGTVTHLAAFSTSSVTAHSMTLNGCPSEAVNNGSGTITLKVTSITACTLTFTPPAGTWYVDKPIGVSGSNYTVYHGGGSQPATQTYVFSSTPATRRTYSRTFNCPSGATAVKVRFGSTTDYIANPSCSGGAATATLTTPTGSQALSWDYVGGPGGSSTAMTETIN